MTDYTPTPWFAVNRGTEDEPMMSVMAARIAGREPRHVVALVATGDNSQAMENANAAFICVACNAHDWLMREVAETKALLAYIRKHDGNCPADHPKLLTKMDELIGRKVGEPQMEGLE